MTANNDQIEEKLKALPKQPGVYLMKDARARIIYVGKAKILRQRVRSYFQKIDWRTQPKSAALVRRIHDFDYVVTESEVDALILEGNLIKQHKPRYNVLLKDDKAFPFIKLTNELFPRVEVTRKIIKDGARYFGPYTDAKAMRRTLDLIRKVFPLRTCPSSGSWASMERPCLEEIFIPGQSNPILILKTSPALKILMQARDEAHRFALTFHRQQRGQRMIKSDLDNIPGVGPKRKQSLIKRLGSVEKIRTCSFEELSAMDGLGKDAARKVFTYFHPEG